MNKYYYSTVYSGKKVYFTVNNGVYDLISDATKQKPMTEEELESSLDFLDLEGYTIKRSKTPDYIDRTDENMATKPKHYNDYRLETIEAIYGQSTGFEFVGFLKGNIMKYLSRYPFKNGVEDLKKAQFYLDLLTYLEDGETFEQALQYVEQKGGETFEQDLQYVEQKGGVTNETH